MCDFHTNTKSKMHICTSQHPVTMTKHLTQATYETERFILVHDCGVSSLVSGVLAGLSLEEGRASSGGIYWNIC